VRSIQPGLVNQALVSCVNHGTGIKQPHSFITKLLIGICLMAALLFAGEAAQEAEDLISTAPSPTMCVGRLGGCAEIHVRCSAPMSEVYPCAAAVNRRRATPSARSTSAAESLAAPGRSSPTSEHAKSRATIRTGTLSVCDH
jgi:hypothetical protein